MGRGSKFYKIVVSFWQKGQFQNFRDTSECNASQFCVLHCTHWCKMGGPNKHRAFFPKINKTPPPPRNRGVVWNFIESRICPFRGWCCWIYSICTIKSSLSIPEKMGTEFENKSIPYPSSLSTLLNATAQSPHFYIPKNT